MRTINPLTRREIRIGNAKQKIKLCIKLKFIYHELNYSHDLVKTSHSPSRWKLTGSVEYLLFNSKEQNTKARRARLKARNKIKTPAR
jgi:hypothetical protein